MPYKNKEDRRANSKKYYKANKKKILAYHQTIKEKKAATSKAWKEARMDGLYTVYLIVPENYVGMTTCLYQRLSDHKSKNNRDVSDVYIIGKYKTKAEAREVENKYHKMGYDGAYGYNGRCKNTIAGVDFTESLNNLNNLL
tara:strand:- start:336 stop:758 length:423 start_codon:yes stop_codon:yes gene_type:complete